MAVLSCVSQHLIDRIPVVVQVFLSRRQDNMIAFFGEQTKEFLITKKEVIKPSHFAPKTSLGELFAVGPFRNVVGQLIVGVIVGIISELFHKGLQGWKTSIQSPTLIPFLLRAVSALGVVIGRMSVGKARNGSIKGISQGKDIKGVLSLRQ